MSARPKILVTQRIHRRGAAAPGRRTADVDMNHHL